MCVPNRYSQETRLDLPLKLSTAGSTALSRKEHAGVCGPRPVERYDRPPSEKSWRIFRLPLKLSTVASTALSRKEHG